MQAFNRINIIDDPDETWDSNLLVLASSDLVLVITQSFFVYVSKRAFYQGSLNCRDWQKDPDEKVYIIEKTHSLFNEIFKDLSDVGPLRNYSIVSVRPILDKIYQIGLQGKPPPAFSNIPIVPSTLSWDRLFQLPKAPWTQQSKWLFLQLGDDYSFIYFHKLGISLSVYQIECLQKASKLNFKPVAYIRDRKLPYILALPPLLQLNNCLFVGPVLGTENLDLSLLCVRNGILVNRDEILTEKHQWSRLTAGSWLYKKLNEKSIDLRLKIANSIPELNSIGEYELDSFDAKIPAEPYHDQNSDKYCAIPAIPSVSNSKMHRKEMWKATEKKRKGEDAKATRKTKRKPFSEETSSETSADISQEEILRNESNSSVKDEEILDEDSVKIKSEPIYDVSDDSVLFIDETSTLLTSGSSQSPNSIAERISEAQPEVIFSTFTCSETINHVKAESSDLLESIVESEENYSNIKQESIEKESNDPVDFHTVWIKKDNFEEEKNDSEFLESCVKQEFF